MSFVTPTAIQAGVFQQEVGLCQSWGSEILGEAMNLEANSVLRDEGKKTFHNEGVKSTLSSDWSSETKTRN